jgi:hypothetical protein
MQNYVWMYTPKHLDLIDKELLFNLHLHDFANKSIPSRPTKKLFVDGDKRGSRKAFTEAFTLTNQTHRIWSCGPHDKRKALGGKAKFWLFRLTPKEKRKTRSRKYIYLQSTQPYTCIA